MKKLIAIVLILCMLIPAATLAEKDPIAGAWYILLDYNQLPYEDSTGISATKNYMVYLLIFEDSGTISGFSGESVQGVGFYGTGTTLGTWIKSGDTYTTTIIGLGTSNPYFKDDRLILPMTNDVAYSMRRLEWGDWITDLIPIH